MIQERFVLDDNFTKKYVNKTPNWGFGALSEITFYRTYSRKKLDGTKESWYDCVKRVVEGTFSIQKDHIKKSYKKWDERKGQRSAQRMFQLMFDFKFTPPGRGLWAMGSPIIMEKGLGAALNNCAFVSTENLGNEDPTKPFIFLMDMSMLGVGVGFDTEGAGKLSLSHIGKKEKNSYTYVIPDSREGWVRSVMLRLAYWMTPEEDHAYPVFDPSLVRAAGEPIKGFGGTASGPGPLIELHSRIDEIFEGTPEEKLINIVQAMNNIRYTYEDDKFKKYYDILEENSWYDKDLPDTMNTWAFYRSSIIFHSKIILDDKYNATYEKYALPEYITETQITNLCNCIGICVVSGNVRRSALIGLSSNSFEFNSLKDYKLNPERVGIGWTSNNSNLSQIGQDYTDIANSIEQRGEPGSIWLQNIRDYGRMCESPNYKDRRAKGCNPCAEQSLESYELCCLVEDYMNNIHNIEEFKDVLKFSYMYAKTVTLCMTHWEETNEVIARNRRIGTSLTGVVQFVDRYGLNTYVDFIKTGYDEIQKYDQVYSEWFGVPRSIKTTSIKPSGTVSLLAGATPGVHWPKSSCYFRTVRISKTDPLIVILRAANYRIEDDVVDPSAYVIYFPIRTAEVKRNESQVSIWEKITLVELTQKWWADNMVSCTITYDAATESKFIKPILEYFQYSLKSVSFLPISNKVYNQMPYTSCTVDEYTKYNSLLKPLDFSSITEVSDVAQEQGCDGEKCDLPIR